MDLLSLSLSDEVVLKFLKIGKVKVDFLSKDNIFSRVFNFFVWLIFLFVYMACVRFAFLTQVGKMGCVSSHFKVFTVKQRGENFTKLLHFRNFTKGTSAFQEDGGLKNWTPILKCG